MRARNWAGALPAVALTLALGACAGEDGAATSEVAPTVTTTATATVTETVTATVTATPSETASVRGFVDTGAGESSAAATPKPKPKPKPKPAPEPANVYYENCDAVRAAGADPIRVGDPGYSRDLDRDGDGVACE